MRANKSLPGLDPFLNPTEAIIVGSDKVTLAHKPLIIIHEWDNREQKDYAIVEPDLGKDESFDFKVEVSVATKVEATDVINNVMAEVDCNCELNKQYTETIFPNPIITTKPSSDLLNISQVLNSIAGAGIDEKAIAYQRSSSGLHDYTGCFEYTKSLVMLEPDNFLLVQPYPFRGDNNIRNQRFFLTKEAAANISRAKNDINRLISFNHSMYIQCGTTQEQGYCEKYVEELNSSQTATYGIITKQPINPIEKDILFVSLTLPVSQFEAPLIPVMTTNALDVLQKQAWVYDAGFDLSILPLGFSISTVESLYQDYETVVKGKEIKIVFNTNKKQSYILDWDGLEYQKQKDIHSKNLLDPTNTNAYVKALFTIDPLEFNEIQEDRELITLLSKHASKSLDDIQAEFGAFLGHCSLIKKYNKNLYDAIEESFSRKLSSSQLISVEAFRYLQEFARLAILPAIEVDQYNAELVSRASLANYQADFAIAVFNSMDKSNFIQISRALTAFFIKFDEMTDFYDIKTKLKFYKLLIESTTKNNTLCIKGLEGCAQIELFKLFKILDKTAAQGPKLLEFQLQLLCSEDRSEGISLSPHGDFRAHQRTASLSYSSTTFSDSGLVLIDPFMMQSKPDDILTEAVPLDHQTDDDIHILGWLSRKFASDSKLFGTTNIEHKVAIYKNIKDIVLRIAALGDDYSDLSTSFSNLCKLYVSRSLPFETSAFNEALIWLEGLAKAGHNITSIPIPKVSFDGDPLKESEKFKGVFYAMYTDFSTCVADTLNISSNPSNSTLRSPSKAHSFLDRVKVHNKTGCLAVHNKNARTCPDQAIEMDISRYKKLWNLSASVRAHILSCNPKALGDPVLETFFEAMGKPYKSLTQNSQNGCNYQEIVIDTRFLSLRALCIDVPYGLGPEKSEQRVIDWINKWVDSCDLRLQTSEFIPVPYEEFQSKTASIESYEQLLNVMHQLFPKISYIKGNEFSLKNILKGPNRIQIDIIPLSKDFSRDYEPIEFFQNLDSLLESCNLQSQKQEIIYNAIYKLFEHKIYRSQIAKFKDGNIQNIEFKDPEKLNKYTQIICDSYLEDIYDLADIQAESLLNETSRYIAFALPILEDFSGAASSLKFYKPFQRIYGECIGEFFAKIQSYSDILQSKICEKFQDPSRETSYDNFYDALTQTSNLWRPQLSKGAAQYFRLFHKYLDSVLDFGVLSQELNGHNFTAIMKAALGLLANPTLQKGLQKFDAEHQGSAVSIFDRLAQISIRRTDCLVFEYCAHLTDSNQPNLFASLSEQLQHDSDGLEELVYNIDAKLYASRFEAFSLVISSEGNLANIISILNSILSNDYGPDKESIITNSNELVRTLKRLNNLTGEHFLLLKRYLTPPASCIYDKDTFESLFNHDQFNANLCKQHLQNVLQKDRYKFDKAAIREKFAKIKGVKNLDGLVSDYGKVFKVLDDIASIDDTTFQQQLKDPTNDLALAAYIIDGVCRVTGRVMRPIQIATLLLTIKGDSNLLHQLKTGQGKTDAIAMVAAFYAKKDIGIDISTDTFELASRDARTLFPLYAFLGIPSNVNAITPTGTGIDDYANALINYGTLGEIKLAKNTAVQSGKVLPKRRTILISDEFDADRDNKTLYRLSRTPEFKGINNVTTYLKIMLEYMVDFVDDEKQADKKVFNLGQKTEEQQKQDKANFKEFMARKAALLFSKAKQNTRKASIYNIRLAHLELVYEMIDQICHKEIALLLDSCYDSKHAYEEWKVGEQYNEIPRYKLIRYSGTQDRIILIKGILPIVNGKFNLNSWHSKFSDGLQQFIAIRKNKSQPKNSAIYYDVEPFTHTSAVDAPSNLLFGRSSGDYERVIGFSGTVGNKHEKERMKINLKIDTFIYPEHEDMPKVGLFEQEEQEDYGFLAETSRTRFDKYVLLARTKTEKIDYLVEIIKRTIKAGRVDPFLLLCNNHEEVYEYQEELERRLKTDKTFSDAIIGIQTSGLGSMKSLSDNDKVMSSRDEKAYLDLRKKLNIEGNGDRSKPLIERIIDQASLAGVITFGTIGNNSRGTNVRKHKEHPRELHTIVLGCNKELLTPSALIQSLGRTFGRFEGRAGVIVTREEVVSELKKFGATIDPTHLIVQHFYKLMNLAASHHTKTREKNRIFNIVWEVIQKQLHNKITNPQNASEIRTKLTDLYTDLYQEWNPTETYDTFCKKAFVILSEKLEEAVVKELMQALEAEAKHYDFKKNQIQKEELLLPGPPPNTAFYRLKLYIQPFIWKTPNSIAKLAIWFTPIALGKFYCNTALSNALLPIISGTLIGFLFQDATCGDKREQLGIWHYESNLIFATSLLGAGIGLVAALQQPLLNHFMNMGSTTFPLMKTVITISITGATATYAHSYMQHKVLKFLDANAEYNLPPEIEV